MKPYNEFSYYEKLYLIYTLHCPLHCDHCLMNSSPQRKEHMELSDALSIISTSINQGIRIVQLTGGEIFTRYADLEEMIALIYGMGACAMLETNGFWANDIIQTRKIIEHLHSIGLRKIMTSADHYHRSFIPFSNLVNIWNVCSECGIENIVLYINCPNESINKREKDIIRDSGIIFEENDLLTLGRASHAGITYDHTIFDVEPCDSIALTVHYNGDVFACCALSDINLELKQTPLFLGNMHDTAMEAIISSFFTNPWIKLLAENGHVFIYEQLKKCGSLKNTDHIRCICDWCKANMKNLQIKELFD